MKKTIYTFLFGLAAIVMFESFDFKSLGKQQDGSNPGFTGSPGDSLKNCTVCHGGNAVTLPNWITSDVPAEGFEPGETYTIRARNISIGHTRFGFSVSPQAIDGKQLGTLIVTDPARTQLNGNGKYITYKTQGVFGTDSAVWMFNWVAPTDVNEVTFYGAFNSNHEGHKGGDLTTLSTLKLYKKGFTSIKENGFGLNLNVFPNPSQDVLNISLKAASSENVNLAIYNIKGEQVWLGSNRNATNLQEKIELTNWPQGIYFLQVQQGNNKLIEKLVITQ